jgi:hypothetical protein
MRATIKSVLSCIAVTSILAVSCQKSDKAVKQEEISTDVLKQIQQMGFSTDGVIKKGNGYLVEGDIFLSSKHLSRASSTPNVRVAETEQYRTYNLVNALPRTVTISVTDLSDAYVTATDTAIARYNALGLRLQFERVSSGGDINIQGFYEGPSGGYITLGSAGFPTDIGDPYNEVLMNTHPDAYGENPDVLYIASVIQHEVGHCIGFRHTDYMNRAYSCGGRRYNEGSAGIGAVNIPGTPTKADPNSWMLACSNGGNRTFNANDVIALNYLYR